MYRGHFDVVVVGGGAIGLSTAYQCAKSGQKTAVLEQSVFFNQGGSSGDFVRMFRTAYTENFMADLAHTAMQDWKDLEKELRSGEQLREMCGLLNFGDPKYGSGGPEGTLTGPICNLKRLGMSYEEIKAVADLESKFPFQNLPDDWQGIDMPDNGVINVPLLLRTLHRLALENKAKLLQYATVQRIRPDPDSPKHWLIDFSQGGPSDAASTEEMLTFRTKKVIITSGAWVNRILEPSFGISLDINIWEMVYEYYALDTEVAMPKMWFQFADDTPSDHGPPVSNLFYGFPPVPWGPPNLSRIAVDAATNIVKDPTERRYAVISSEDLRNTRDWVKTHVRGVGQEPVPVFAGACLQTNLPDNMFVLDFLPDKYMFGEERSKSVAVFTAGWAMKFVPLIGKALRDLAVHGTTGYDISHFKIDRKFEDKSILLENPTNENLSALATDTRRTMGHQSGSSTHRRAAGH